MVTSGLPVVVLFEAAVQAHHFNCELWGPVVLMFSSLFLFLDCTRVALYHSQVEIIPMNTLYH